MSKRKLKKALKLAAKLRDTEVARMLAEMFREHERRISNGADRKAVVVMLREQIKRFEGQPELKGRA